VSKQSLPPARRHTSFILRESFRQIISMLLVWVMAMTTLPSTAWAEDPTAKPLTVWHPDASQTSQTSLPSSVEPKTTSAHRTPATRTRIKSSPAINPRTAEILLAQAQSMNGGGGLSANVFQEPRPGATRLSPEQVKELGDTFHQPEKDKISNAQNRILMARAEPITPPLAPPTAANSSVKLSPATPANNLALEFALMPLRKAAPVTPAMVMVQSPPQIAGLAVSVGYADDLRANPNFPVPWQGSPNTVFIGQGPGFDSGAIRIDNNPH